MRARRVVLAVSGLVAAGLIPLAQAGLPGSSEPSPPQRATPAAAAAATTGAKSTGGTPVSLPGTPVSLPGTTGRITAATSPSPQRTVISDDLGILATFTLGSRTVALRGPARTLTEPGSTARVNSSTWVRLLPDPYAGTVDWTWLSSRLSDTSPDVLQVALQYVSMAPAVVDTTGRQVAGDASYGPLEPDGSRDEGSDFNDYLGVPATYGAEADDPEREQFRSLDCSGFLRMVLGHRGGVPLARTPDGSGLPRRSFQMLDDGPGVVLLPDLGTRPGDLSALAPGDLLFFDASGDDGTRIDHVAMYLGRDAAGAHRFVSSRKTADGPTMGDAGGRSTLTGTGLYATSFRAARRI